MGVFRRFINRMLQQKPLPQSHYKAGRTNRAFGSSVPNSGPNVASTPYLPTLRSRVRDEVRNSPIAARAVDILVSEMVGTGIVPLAIASDDRKKALADLWKRWEDYADFDGRTDIYGLQAMAVRAWKESGECFVRLVVVPYDGSDVAPLRLQLLEADMVPLINGEAPDSGNKVLLGIEFDKQGRRVAYWVYRAHPGDYPLAGGAFLGVTGKLDPEKLIRVPADEMLHIYKPDRPGQLRGVPALAACLQTIAQLADFDEATLERQKHAAALTFFIRRPAPLDPGTDPVTGQTIDPNVVTESTINPGSAYTLLPGEEVESPSLPDLGNSYADFTRHNMRNIAGAAGMPYELLTGDYSGTNDRTARVALGSFRRRMQQEQWGVVVHQLCRPVLQKLIQQAILNGMARIDLATVTVRWTPQAWPYINPLQDVQAQEYAIKAGLVSRTATIIERGDDPEQVDAERKADQEREKSLELRTDQAGEP